MRGVRTVHVLGVDRSNGRESENDDNEGSPGNGDTVNGPAEEATTEMERSGFEHDLCRIEPTSASIKLERERKENKPG